jgi:hypothetical protein
MLEQQTHMVTNVLQKGTVAAQCPISDAVSEEMGPNFFSTRIIQNVLENAECFQILQ